MKLPLGSGPWAAVIVFVTVFLGAISLALAWEALRRWQRQRRIDRQLTRLVNEGAGSSSDEPELRREEHFNAVDALLLRVPRLRDLQHLLRQADSGWNVGTFMLLTAGTAAAFGVTASLLMRSQLMALLIAIFGALLPYLMLRRRRRKRLNAFEESFPEAIDLMGRSLRAGHALNSSFQVVASEAPSPISQEFRQVFEEQKFGLPLRDSLAALADRIDLVDVQMFITSILIQRESGGNLAENLDNLSGLIRQRFKFRRQLKVYTAQGRMTGYLLGVLPIGVGLALWTIQPDYLKPLFHTSPGKIMLAGGILLQIIGFLLIRRIIDIEF